MALGIKDLIVINTNDATLVAHKNQSENIKEIVRIAKRIPEIDFKIIQNI